jgi:hypothetical protein
MTQTYLAKDRFSHAIQALLPSISQNVAYTSASSTPATNAFDASTVVIRLLATADCYVSIGLASAVSASAGSMLLAAYVPEYFRVPEAALNVPTSLTYKVGVMAVAASGTLNITEMT